MLNFIKISLGCLQKILGKGGVVLRKKTGKFRTLYIYHDNCTKHDYF